MNLAILIVSSVSLVCSCGCLCILVKGAQKAKHIENELETVKAKLNHNAKVVSVAVKQLEF